MVLAALIWPRGSTLAPDVPAALAAAEPRLWLAPDRQAGASAIAAAVDDLINGKAARALPVLARAAARDELGGYALLYLGQAHLALARLPDAQQAADRLLASAPGGYLAEAARWLQADIAEAAGDWPRTMDALKAILESRPLAPERAYLRLGRASVNAGHAALGADALRKVYYEHALSREAEEAAAELAKLGVSLVPGSPEEFARQFDRAQQLYDGRRFADARAAFALLRDTATGDDRSLVELRIAQCDFHTGRYAAANEALRPLIRDRVEAEFFLIGTLRELRQYEEYVRRARAFVEGHPAHPLAEETLNTLATHFILTDEDGKAAEIFSEMFARFPSGARATRAAWRAGWWKYKNARYAEAIAIFESAAQTFPRDDYRPSWLYWAARARQRLGQRDEAADAFRRVIADYRNSYYGRQAARALAALVPGFGRVEPAARSVPVLSPGEPPPTAPLISELLAAGLYDAAIMEVRKAQAEFGSSPLLEATMAYALNRKGELRPAIIRMRRAYPQFLGEGGEQLPDEIRRVIFPMAYWDLISKYAAERKLDPYLMAALIAQESTFQADVKSPAGAWGLMQIMPATGRMIARRLKIRPYSTARLKQPEVNVRIGMANFASVLARYGDVAAALAAYNAGNSRVTRWLAERPDLDQDEFIDDIPFPETQNYVKRVLGAAEDYRRLYAAVSPAAAPPTPPRKTAATPAAQSTPAKKGKSSAR